MDQKYYHILTKDEYESITRKKLKKKYALAIRGVTPIGNPTFTVKKNDGGMISVETTAMMSSDPTKLHKVILLIQVDDLPDNIGVDFYVVG